MHHKVSIDASPPLAFLHLTESEIKSCSSPASHRVPPLLTKSQKASLSAAPHTLVIHPALDLWIMLTWASLPPHYLPQSQPQAILVLVDVHFCRGNSRLIEFFACLCNVYFSLFSSICGVFLLMLKLPEELRGNVKWINNTSCKYKKWLEKKKNIYFPIGFLDTTITVQP